jgi:cyclopropane fatty-acyl-phospholipid synthase-like methyltransferase
MKKQFHSNTAELEKRIAANKSTLYDLEEWIFSQIELDPIMEVLDLGCGTGKQIFTC